MGKETREEVKGKGRKVKGGALFLLFPFRKHRFLLFSFHLKSYREAKRKRI
jgi:hypothetical protein